jgi:hypothetical protein
MPRSNELCPEDCVHTLVAVHTDEGLTGVGSVFANDGLVRAALHVLWCSNCAGRSG